jgi:c-di-GMP-binding flagellar brake protein YcgR
VCDIAAQARNKSIIDVMACAYRCPEETADETTLRNVMLEISGAYMKGKFRPLAPR